MSEKTREDLKEIWVNGVTMTETLFDDLFDSVLVKNSDVYLTSTTLTTPDGDTFEIQVNSSNTFTSSSNLKYDFDNNALTVGVRSGSAGQYSTVLGYECEVNGDYSIASGFYTTANGNYSTASGYYTIASGNYSTASGFYTTASGSYSTAFGFYTTASGNYSFTGGYGYGNTYPIIASGITSFNHSYREYATDNVSGATGDYSAILGGKNNSAIGEGSVVLGGSGNVSSGYYSTVLGYECEASGDFQLLLVKLQL